MPSFHVTYEIVTPESAAHADAAERGFVTGYGQRVELKGHVFGGAARLIKNDCAMRLRPAIELIGCVEGNGGNYYETDPRQNYKNGHETRYALHAPDKITASSLRRLERLLKSMRLLR